MSALLAPNPDPSRPRKTAVAHPGRNPSTKTRRPALRPLASPPRRMARLPFLGVLIGAFVLGMGGLLMVNTTLQNQAFEARTLNRQALQLTYVQSDLESQLDQVAAPDSLARQASALGMRPNPYPAFLVLPSGKVVGKAKVVDGDELPELIPKTAAQLAAEQAALDTSRRDAPLRQLQQQVAAAAAQAKAAAAAQAKAAADAQAKADAAKTATATNKSTATQKSTATKKTETGN